jgi:hypothetical protein
MHKFNWAEERGADGTPLVRTLRSLLRHELPSILPKTREINSQIIDDLSKSANGQPHLSNVVRHLVARTNARVFFGEDIGIYSASVMI